MTTSYHPTQNSEHDPQSDQVVSRHLTSQGVLTYFRSPDGQLRAQLRHWNGERGIEAGHRRTEARCA